MKMIHNFIRNYLASRSKAVYGIPSHYSELFHAMNLKTLQYRDDAPLKSSVTVFFRQPPHPTIMDSLMIIMCFIFLSYITKKFIPTKSISLNMQGVHLIKHL
jgi:hypothetical protein